MARALSMQQLASRLAADIPLTDLVVRKGQVYHRGYLDWMIRGHLPGCAVETQAKLYQLAYDALRSLDPAVPTVEASAVIRFARGLSRYTPLSHRFEEVARRVDRLATRAQGFIFGVEPSCISYQRPENQEAYKTWMHRGFPPEVFRHYPYFTDLLQKTRLDSVIEKLGGAILWERGKGYLLVDGAWSSIDSFCDRFKPRFFEEFHETLLEEVGTGLVWSYQGDHGFIPYHPYNFEALKPLTHISQQELSRVQELGRRFHRPEGAAEVGGQPLPFVMQVVSSYNKSSPGPLGMSEGVRRTFRRPKHPWLRLITADGAVYSVGYNWEEPIKVQIASNEHGRMRSPDRWEFMPADERVLTNIGLTEAEGELFLSLVNDYQKAILEHSEASPTFNLLRQNCSVFVKAMLKQLLDIDIDTEATLQEVISAILPFKPTAIRIDGEKHQHSPLLADMPLPLQLIGEAIGVGRSITCGARNAGMNAIFFTLFGGCAGPRGTRFIPDEEGLDLMHPPAHKLWEWFDQDVSAINLPVKVQIWQLAQLEATELIPCPDRVHITRSE